MSMANEKNLRPLNTRPQRERKEIAKMGAKASNRVQKNKKLLREAAEVLLATSADKGVKAMLKSYKIAANDCTYAMAVVVAQLKKAIAGDTKAFIASECPKQASGGLAAPWCQMLGTSLFYTLSKRFLRVCKAFFLFSKRTSAICPTFLPLRATLKVPCRPGRTAAL